MNRKNHNLLNYINELNVLAKFFGPKTNPITLESCKELAVYKKIYTALDIDLSPENLTADGERSRRKVDTLRRRLIGAWRELNVITGLAIDYDSPELTTWHEENMVEFRKSFEKRG